MHLPRIREGMFSHDKMWLMGGLGGASLNPALLNLLRRLSDGLNGHPSFPYGAVVCSTEDSTWRKSVMTGYDPFAKFYDAVMGEPTETATLLEALIQEFHPNATRVLELACGTGAVLKHLRHTYQMVGLDLSAGMLEVARRNIPDVPFYQDDMSTFSLPLSFDVIYCVFDSVNHLSTWEKWQSLFRHVDQHLGAQGLFIFDINTLFKLERLAQAPTEVQEFVGNYLLMKVTQTANNLYDWRLQIFEQVGNDLYRRHETTILETSFPLAPISQALQECFEIKRLFDPRNTEVVPTSLRVYFVCQKRE